MVNSTAMALLTLYRLLALNYLRHHSFKPDKQQDKDLLQTDWQTMACKPNVAPGLFLYVLKLRINCMFLNSFLKSKSISDFCYRGKSISIKLHETQVSVPTTSFTPTKQCCYLCIIYSLFSPPYRNSRLKQFLSRPCREKLIYCSDS